MAKKEEDKKKDDFKEVKEIFKVEKKGDNKVSEKPEEKILRNLRKR